MSAQKMTRLSPMPVPPNRREDPPSTFSEKAQSTADALKVMVEELNERIVPAHNATVDPMNSILPSVPDINTVAAIAPAVAVVADNAQYIAATAPHIDAVVNASNNMPAIVAAPKHAADAKYWAEQAAGIVDIGPASETKAGLVRLATASEVAAGTNPLLSISPVTLSAGLSKKADKDANEQAHQALKKWSSITDVPFATAAQVEAGTAGKVVDARVLKEVLGGYREDTDQGVICVIKLNNGAYLGLHSAVTLTDGRVAGILASGTDKFIFVATINDDDIVIDTVSVIVNVSSTFYIRYITLMSDGRIAFAATEYAGSKTSSILGIFTVNAKTIAISPMVRIAFDFSFDISAFCAKSANRIIFYGRAPQLQNPNRNTSIIGIASISGNTIKVESVRQLCTYYGSTTDWNWGYVIESMKELPNGDVVFCGTCEGTLLNPRPIGSLMFGRASANSTNTYLTVTSFSCAMQTPTTANNVSCVGVLPDGKIIATFYNNYIGVVNVTTSGVTISNMFPYNASNVQLNTMEWKKDGRLFSVGSIKRGIATSGAAHEIALSGGVFSVGNGNTFGDIAYGSNMVYMNTLAGERRFMALTSNMAAFLATVPSPKYESILSHPAGWLCAPSTYSASVASVANDFTSATLQTQDVYTISPVYTTLYPSLSAFTDYTSESYTF